MISDYFQKLETLVHSQDRISLRDIAGIAEDDVILITIILLSILNIILAPLPFNSFLLGAPLILLSILYLFAIDPLRLNFQPLQKSFCCLSWRKFFSSARPMIAKLERLGRPRWKHVTRYESRILSGLCFLLLSLIIFLPIPFLNIPGSIAMIGLAIGILQKDGVLLATGYAGLTALILTSVYLASIAVA